MRWAEIRMCRFWAGGISSFPFSRAREYRLLRRLVVVRKLEQVVSYYKDDGCNRLVTSCYDKKYTGCS